MKRTLQKPIALLLALIMAFGAMPFAGIGMVVSAADPVLENVIISPDPVTLTELGATQTFTLKPIWKNNVSGEFLARHITWRSSSTEYLTVEGSTETPTAVATVEKLPSKLDESVVVTVTADYLNNQGVKKTADVQVTLTRKNDDFNVLRSIKFNPSEITLKTVGETAGLAIDWNWNTDMTKFDLYPADLTFQSSNTDYLKVTKLKGLGSGGLYTEDQNVVLLEVQQLPPNVGSHVDVTVTAQYKNSKGVNKTATALVTIAHFSGDVVLKEIQITPDKVTFTNVGDTVQLAVNPVWLNTSAGTFDASKVTWSVALLADKKYISVTDKGLLTALDLPANVGDSYSASVRASYLYDNEVFTTTCTVTLTRLSSPSGPKSITITPNTLTVKDVGFTQQLYVIATYDSQTMPVTVGVAYTSSDESLIKVSSTGLLEVVGTPAPNQEDKVVTVTAYYWGKTATCTVTIPKRHIYVDSINLDWSATAVVTNVPYKFSDVFTYTTFLTETPPAGVTVDDSVTVSISPATSATMDAAHKIITFRPISVTSTKVTITLTANNPSPNCKPVQFVVTVYDDVPLESILWDYPLGSTGITHFSYYDTTTPGVKQIAGHYYEKTSGSLTTYMYHTIPDYARAACTITVKVENPRVLRLDEKTKCLIPVGNGDTQLTITAKTPKGVTRSHTITVRVDESPYNPIKSVKIGYDPDSVSSGVTYDSGSNKLNMMFGQKIKLVPKLTALQEDKTPNLEQKEITFTTLDGRVLTLVETPTVSWTSSDPSVAKVNAKTGEIEAVGYGKTTITLKIDDNGEVFTEKITIRAKMRWWEAFIGLITSIVTFHWKEKVKFYWKGLTDAIAG